MISGSLNEPPISTNSPRETITSRRRARLPSTSISAAALLLTTVAASAPVSRRNQASTCSSRSPRWPVARSNSRLDAPAATCAMAASACSGSGARPRLVCNTVPLRLKTGRSEGWAQACNLAVMPASRSAGSGAAPGSGAAKRAAARRSASSARTASSTGWRPCEANSPANPGQANTWSTAGRRSPAGIKAMSACPESAESRRAIR